MKKLNDGSKPALDIFIGLLHQPKKAKTKLFLPSIKHSCPTKQTSTQTCQIKFLKCAHEDVSTHTSTPRAWLLEGTV